MPLARPHTPLPLARLETESHLGMKGTLPTRLPPSVVTLNKTDESFSSSSSGFQKRSNQINEMRHKEYHAIPPRTKYEILMKLTMQTHGIDAVVEVCARFWGFECFKISQSRRWSCLFGCMAQVLFPPRQLEIALDRSLIFLFGWSGQIKDRYVLCKGVQTNCLICFVRSCINNLFRVTLVCSFSLSFLRTVLIRAKTTYNPCCVYGLRVLRTI